MSTTLSRERLVTGVEEPAQVTIKAGWVFAASAFPWRPSRLLLVVAVPLALFYRPRLVDAWRRTAQPRLANPA